MDNQIKELEKRWKDNIRDYDLSSLYEMNELRDYLKCLATVTGVSILLTQRHGEKALVIGDFDGFVPDVVNSPGRKIRVLDRTIGHLYVINKSDRPDKRDNIEELIESLVKQLQTQATLSFRAQETLAYAEELEQCLEKESYQTKHAEKNDTLTGVLSKRYFKNRMNVVERSYIVPVAVICMNINDWKYVNSNYGNDESDRLIKIIASFLKKEAKPEYVIGRVDGDVFYVLIPMAEEGEAYEYCRKVQSLCQRYQDTVLSPSIACGFVHKTNIEESLEELFSEAEYEMFQNKIEIKSMPDYRTLLEKGMLNVVE